MPIFIADRQSYSIQSKRVYTDEGFLRVPGSAARTGIQQYLASELELTDRAPNTIVNVYRPPEEVFSADSLASYAAADVTDNHPKKLIDSATYRDVVRGVVIGPGVQDGDFVVVDLVIKDAEAIKAVESGKVQLSAGYIAEYDNSPGVTPDGQHYEFIQRNIRINHVALVDRARAGAQARLFDKNPGVTTMHKVVLDSGIQVEVSDEATAMLITQDLDHLKKRVKDAEATAAEAEKEKAKLEAEKDEMAEEVEKAKESTSDEAISALIKSVADAKADAVKLAGESFTCGSVDVMTIKRAALKAAKPDLNLDGKSDEYITARFDSAVESADSAGADVEKQRRQIAQDAASKTTTDSEPKLTPRQKAAMDKQSAHLGGNK